MKTVSVALVICLNVGVDPPDVTKTDPCARQVLDSFDLQQYSLIIFCSTGKNAGLIPGH